MTPIDPVDLLRGLFEKTEPLQPALDRQGGLVLTGDELKRGKAVDLVTLPPAVPGTTCANCKYFVKGKTENSVHYGHCKHVKINMTVTGRMCCALWDATGTLRSWVR